jgi:hypothetical protein
MKTRLTAVLALTLTTAALAAEPAAGTIDGKLEGLGKGPFLVYVEKIDGVVFPPNDPPPVMSQRKNTYLPHILPVLAGSKVELRSEDPELHNVYALATAIKKVLFNIAIVPRTPPQFQTFAKEGVVRLTCNVHKEMLAFVIVLQNPHYTLVEKGATFTLAGVPPGKQVLRVWGEKLDDEVNARKFPVEVTAGGTVKVTISDEVG